MKQLLSHFKDLTLHPANAEALKGLILKLALRGNLTRSINGHYTDNIKDEAEGLYNIPKGWHWDKFDNLVDFSMGKTPPSKDPQYWDDGIPWVSITDMETYATITETKRTLSKRGLKDYFKDSLVKKGTLIMSFKLTIGKTSILGVDACHNEAIISIYPREKILQEYLYRFLPIISNSGDQVSALMGNTLNKGKIQELKVPVPPLEEQKAIVAVVNQLFAEVDELVNHAQKRIQLKADFATSALARLTASPATETAQEWAFLQPHFGTFFNQADNIKKLRETILQLAVQGKLTAKWRAAHGPCLPPGGTAGGRGGIEHAADLLERIKAEKAKLVKAGKLKKEKPLPAITPAEIPNDLPEGWEWCRLGEATTYGTSEKAETKHMKPEQWVLELEDVEKETSKLLQRVTFSNRQFKSTKSVFKKDDVIYGKLRPYLDKVIVADDGGVCTTEMIPIRSYSKCQPEYLRWFLKSPGFIEYANNSTHGMNLPRMGTEKALVALYALPPLQEQTAIVQQVNALMALCDKLETEIATRATTLEDWMKSWVGESTEEFN